MITILVGLLGVLAVGAWVMSFAAAIEIYRMMPAGHKLKSFFNLGWLNFDHIHEIAGPEARKQTRRYVWGLVGFFVAIAGFMVVVFLMIVESQNLTLESTPAAVSQISIPLLPTVSQET